MAENEGVENDTEVEETEDGVENSEEVEEEYAAPSREEWQKLTNAAKARKKERDDARRELAALKSKDSDAEKEPDEAAKWRETAARSSAAVAIQAAGFSGSAKDARWLTGLLSLKDAEPDESGDFDFEDAIDELKERLPQLFAREKAPTSHRKPTTADRGGNSNGPGRDKLSDDLLRMAGYR